MAWLRPDPALRARVAGQAARPE